MSRRFFDLYQYISPLILTPLSFWLWWEFYEGEISLVLMAWLLPIIYAYIVPAVGTNILKVWEFDTKYRLGRFRPHHGFVFGSATAMLAWLSHTAPSTTIFAILQTGFIFASVLGLWNVIYDIKALKSGILKVYNQPWADHKGEEAITMDYAPWFFAGFGFIYGLGVGIAEWISHHYTIDGFSFTLLFFAILILSILFPVWGYRRHSMREHGHDGCRAVGRE